jgi:hypothetical protein
MTWCKEFKEAIEDEIIKLIDYHEQFIDHLKMDREKINITKGFYIIDKYASEEMGLDNYPAEPKVPIKFCPWCGAILTMEDV